MASSRWRQLATALWTDDRKTRIRLQHWSLSVAIYLACAVVASVFVYRGELSGSGLLAWSIALGVTQAALHAMMRSGWSLRLQDPSMSQAQIVVAILFLNAAYALGHDTRSATLLPLTLVLTFGASALPWRRMVELTAFALLVLACTMLAMHMLEPRAYSTTVDLSNFLFCAILLPANTAIAVLLGELRNRLRQQRSELQAALARIQDLATRDELTGLANRRHAHALLDAEAQRTARTGLPFAVALIDLDHFKQLNDTHGHAGGDAMLRAFAAEARSCAREIDVVARWGGEEFLVIMPATAQRAAIAANERLRLQFERLDVPYADDVLHATCSAGVAEHHPGDTIAHTLLRADRALYRAKAAGRNRVEAAPPEPMAGGSGASHDTPPPRVMALQPERRSSTSPRDRAANPRGRAHPPPATDESPSADNAAADPR